MLAISNIKSDFSFAVNPFAQANKGCKLVHRAKDCAEQGEGS
jgi:hypothetical protein